MRVADQPRFYAVYQGASPRRSGLTKEPQNQTASFGHGLQQYANNCRQLNMQVQGFVETSKASAPHEIHRDSGFCLAQ
ncbi:MAG: hypothetical protein E5W31_01545 [Mesorhizobium sp.]|nr:MAG: hypothetical protein E5W31_01545 [Mesorhizobium sp.]